MAIAKKVKYKKDDPEQLGLGVKVLVDAYDYSKRAKHRIDAVKRATKKLSARERATLPEDDAINQHLKQLIDYINSGKCPTDYQRGCQIVIKDAYMEITNGQMSVNEIDTPEDTEAISVEAVCPQEEVASQCDEASEEQEEAPTICEENDNSELTAKDKKELAMYAIDQHYFFLKQLTGVI